MSEVKKVAKNTSSLFIAQIISSILGVILSIFIARKIGDINFGKYSFAIAFTSFFVIFSDLGYHTLLVREVARNRDQASRYLSNIIVIRILLSIIFFVFIAILINLMGYPTDTKNIVYLIGGSAILTAFATIFNMVFRAFEKMEYDAFLNTFIMIIKVILSIFVLYLGYGLLEIGYVFLFVSVIDVLLGFVICQFKFVKPKMMVDISFWRTSIKIALPISLASFFGLIYIKIDSVMLSLMKGDAVVGWYNASYNLTLGLTPIPDLFMNALLPMMVFYSTSKKEKLNMIYEKSFKYLFMLGLPIAVGTTLLAEKIIILFYGTEYVNSIIALQILAWDILLVFLYRCIYYALISVNKQNQVMIIAGLSALINIILNLILIPTYSYVGSGIATLATETVLLGCFFYVSSKNIHYIRLHKIIVKPVIACFVMGLIIYFLPRVNFVIVIIISALVYFFILFISKAIDQQEIKMIKHILKRN
jgi:O-antigen/teichoic acid export membrane protein